MTPIQGGLVVLGFGVCALAAAAAAVTIREALPTAGRRMNARRKGPLPDSRSSAARDVCLDCGLPHPAEWMPLELLIGGGVPVSPGRWFGGRRV